MYPLILIWKESDSFGGGSHGIRGDITLLCLGEMRKISVTTIKKIY
jgi:hypothetical protein